jgi:hypothetical protein
MFDYLPRFAGLPWWDWLVLSAAELKVRRKKSEHRVLYVGHIQPLSKTWARTVGMWGGRMQSSVIKQKTGYIKGSTYDNFRRRRALHTARRKADILHPYAIAMATYREMSVLIEAGHQVGSAANLLWEAGKSLSDELKGQGTSEVCPWIGVLPVEYVLYYYAMRHVLDYHDLTLEQIQDPVYNDTDYKVLWTRAGNPEIGLPPEVEEVYRVEALQDELTPTEP